MSSRLPTASALKEVSMRAITAIATLLVAFNLPQAAGTASPQNNGGQQKAATRVAVFTVEGMT